MAEIYRIMSNWTSWKHHTVLFSLFLLLLRCSPYWSYFCNTATTCLVASFSRSILIVSALVRCSAMMGVTGDSTWSTKTKSSFTKIWWYDDWNRMSPFRHDNLTWHIFYKEEKNTTSHNSSTTNDPWPFMIYEKQVIIYEVQVEMIRHWIVSCQFHHNDQHIFHRKKEYITSDIYLLTSSFSCHNLPPAVLLC